MTDAEQDKIGNFVMVIVMIIAMYGIGQAAAWMSASTPCQCQCDEL